MKRIWSLAYAFQIYLALTSQAVARKTIKHQINSNFQSETFPAKICHLNETMCINFKHLPILLAFMQQRHLCMHFSLNIPEKVIALDVKLDDKELVSVYVDGKPKPCIRFPIILPPPVYIPVPDVCIKIHVERNRLCISFNAKNTNNNVTVSIPCFDLPQANWSSIIGSSN